MKSGNFIYNNKSYDFNFKTSLSAYDKQVFVKTVVKNLIDDDGYDVVIKDLIFDFTIIEVFTNIDTSFINMEDDDGNTVPPIVLVEHFLTETNIADIVKANMENGLLDELNKAVDFNVQYLTGIHFNPLNEAIANFVATIEKKVNEVDLESMMKMAQKFANMTEDFTVENVVKEYMNGDMHKKNLEEIAKAKAKAE